LDLAAQENERLKDALAQLRAHLDAQPAAAGSGAL
jgi:hypothetical protein